jgi:hypothetical protein
VSFLIGFMSPVGFARFVPNAFVPSEFVPSAFVGCCFVARAFVPCDASPRVRPSVSGCVVMVALIPSSVPLASRADRSAFDATEPFGGLPVIDLAEQTASWRGASGQRYLHTVYDFVTCPPLVDAVIVLVRRTSDGLAVPCHINTTSSDCASLNLAAIRQRGAMLCVSEVHAHFVAPSEEARALVVCDLRAGLFGTLAAEPTSHVAPVSQFSSSSANA